MKKMFIAAALAVALLSSCSGNKKDDVNFAKYETVKIGPENSAYTNAISIYGKEVLNLYRFAAMEADKIYWKQVFGDKQALDSAITSPKIKEYADINYGPWDRITGKSFIEGYQAEIPAGKCFYPADMTQAEWEAFDDPAKYSPYTLIRRDSEGKLTTEWYHDAYKENIDKIANYLTAAADLTIVPSVREYLLAKAEDLKTDSYEQSALKWLDTDDSKMDLVLGPNESRDDELHGIKRSFGAFVMLKNLARTAQIAKFSEQLPAFQQSLPCREELKSFKPGTASTIYVCDALYYAGASNCAVKDIAINLPFDTKVQAEKGTRTILMQNVISAKFNSILIPTADLVISDRDREHINDKAFFWNVAFREVAHALGVKQTLDGRTVDEALDSQADVIEETKALALGAYLASDVLGNFETNEIVTKEDGYATFLTALLRSARFGTEGVVGKANVICYNYLKQAGAFSRHQDGCYYIDYDAFHKGISSLVSETLELQGRGDFAAAKQFTAQYGNIDDDLKADAFNMMLEGIPVDVKFDFVW